MESIRWRYQPEFRIQMTIDGEPVTEALHIVPAASCVEVLRNSGAIARASFGSLVCSVKQHFDGVNWVPAVLLTAPRVFTFLLVINAPGNAPSLSFFDQGTSVFGRRILYANNLSGAGAIDSNLASNIVRLTPASDVALADAGSLCGGIISQQFAPGTYTQFRAGKIRAGVAVAFAINQPVAATDPRASIDMTIQPRGSYVLRLEGAAPVEERTVIDPQIAAGAVSGVIEIFRDTWHQPVQPRNYTINFTTS